MAETALGICMHSGWGVLVAVSGHALSPKIVDRRRFEVIDPAVPGAKQPYHHAATLRFAESEKYLHQCASVSKQLAAGVIAELVRQQDRSGCSIIGAAILRSAARPLPPLPNILSSHPLIHTAEGEFFRNVVADACDRLGIPVTSVRERDLATQAQASFAAAARRVQQTIAQLGTAIGPPWTKDHKAATLAASLLLAAAENVSSARPVKKTG